jgi:hypothetical protein
MNTELYIESSRLDITKELSALMTFSIDDIKEFSSRSTSWSKAIVLPGTANNNKVFGHVFQIGRSNPFISGSSNVGFNFNASKSANCILFQDQMQTFKGVLRLMQINYSNGFSGKVEYEVNISGNLSALNAILTGRLLEDLSFSEHNQTFSISNIVQSWDNAPGSGIYYPLIDYGNYSVAKHDWHYRTFRPALYLKEYIDKIFSSANYRYNCDLFQSNRFQRIIVPHSKKEMTITTADLGGATITSTKNYAFPNPFGNTPIYWDNTTGTGFTADPTKLIFTYNGSLTTNVTLNFEFIGSFSTVSFLGSITLEVWKNGTSGTAIYNQFNIFSPFTWTASVPFSIAPGDTIEFRFRGTFGDTVQVTSAMFNVAPTSGSVAIPITLGDQLNANEAIPKNIRQIDFLVGIVKLWNLYVYEDKNDPFLINIKPYIDYYSKNFSYAEDWTLKLDKSRVIKAKPMSELNAKIYKFLYKSDNDYYNELYKKRYNEGYGDRTYDSSFEFSSQTQDAAIVFSGTPIVGYVGEDKYYSTILKRNGNEPDIKEENIDSNIRILQTKKITGVSSYNINDGVNNLQTLTYYGYAGHLDDPTNPSNDLNFGATKELFYVLTTGNLSNNQFNVYWSAYMAEITDKDSKLISAYFKLDPKDILNLDFSKYVYVEGIAFRINQIRDYNATRPGTCIVELLKVSSASYTEAQPPDGPPDGCFLLWSDQEILDWDDSDPLVYSDCEDNPGDGGDPPPPSTYYLNWSYVKAGSGIGWVGGIRIYQNAALVISRTTDGSGSFIINAGDTIEVQAYGSSSKLKNIAIANDVNGSVFSGSQYTTPFSHSFVIDANKNYNATTSMTN